MNRLQQLGKWLTLGLLASIIVACGGGGGSTTSDGGGGGTTPTNSSPTVNAGADQSVDEQSSVTLSGSASDTDGSIASWSWSQTAGTAIELSGADSQSPSFTAPAVLVQEGVQTLTFSVTVTDNDGASATDSINVTVQAVNVAPTLNAGGDQQVDEGSTVQLGATASDSDGLVAAISWQQTSGANVALSSNDALDVSFTAPNNESSQTFTFEVTVTDNEGQSVSDSVTIESRPVIAGIAVDDVLIGSTVQLRNVEDNSLIVETQTDENGRYMISGRETLPERYLFSISGGQLNGQPFTGTLDSVCQRSERLSCNTTPLSTLVKRYADRRNELQSGDKSQWVNTLSAELGFDLASEPFVNEDQSQVPLDTIRVFLQNGDRVDEWVDTTLDYVENDVPNEQVDEWFPTANLLPVANAGSDQVVDEQTVVTLSGSASDADGSVATVAWTQTAGTNVSLNNADALSASFTAPVLTAQETLSFSFTVTDNEGAAVTDSVNVTVNPVNTSPTVNAGNDQSVEEQTTVILVASADDSDGSISAVQWTQTSGTNVSITNAQSVQASFTAPTLTTSETLTFNVTVTDNEGASSNDSVSVIVNPVNATPVVSAGSDQVVDEQTSVSLTAVASDSDGSIVSIQWSQTAGTEVALSNADSSSASFTAPTLTEAATLTFQVQVTDNEGGSSSDSVSVTVNPVNAAPSVDAGDNQSVGVQVQVVLTAAASDSDGSIISYQWSQTAGTSVALTNADSSSVSFTTPDVSESETLVFSVMVTDNEGESASDNVSVIVNVGNAVPIAMAGDDQSVNEQTTVNLSGSGTDSDGSIASYLWSQTSGTSVSLFNADSSSASFTAPTVTEAVILTFKLTVTDDGGAIGEDFINVTINPVNAAPTVNAGSDQSVNEQTTVTLNGSASDSDGSIASYLWTQTSGSSVTLNNADSASSTFTAPTLTAVTTLAFKLTVTDNEGATSEDSISVTVNPVNAVPVVNAGGDQTIDEQTSVTLTGSASDSDGSIASYQWAQTAGTSVSLSNADSASSTFTAPALTSATTLTFNLTVTDNEGGVASDSVSITVNPVNVAPVANAGGDQNVSTGETVTLSGSQSSDGDGDSLTYTWQLDSKPEGSSASLSSTSTVETSFVPDVAGSYVASLVVNDGTVSSAADTVTVTATAVNSEPTGSITISGTTEVGEILTASNTLADADGLGTFSYQWRRTKDSSTTNIENATSTTYTIESGDVGYTLSMNISYTDGAGFAESVSSNESTVVTEATSAGKPNILLIIADDQGVDASAQYSFSSDLPSTPNIDALASSGLVFENVWATPACTTTRGTLITGKHGVNSGITEVPYNMDTSTETIQRYIKSLADSSDYQTAVIGKWHLGGGNPDLSHPTDSGVDYYAGTIAGTIDDYYSWDLVENGQSTTVTDYHTTKMTDLALDWLSIQNSSNTPWFLWLAYVAPHSPFHLPPADLHNRTDLTGEADHIEANQRDYYLASIEAMDSEIGRLLSSMSQKEKENTLIIYIGDNGTPRAVIDTAVFAKNNSKGTLTEGGIRVPMVVSGFGVTRQNEREDALINTTDFYATLSQYVGGSETQIHDSYSFLSLLSSSGDGLRTYNYSEFVSDDVTGWTVRGEDYKYIIDTVATTEALYRVSSDMGETNDLSTDSTLSSTSTQLANQGKTIRGETTTSPIDITDAILTKRSGNCADYVETYDANVTDVNRSLAFNGDLTISVSNGKCVFTTNNIPNHNFNDGNQAFPNEVSAQNNVLEVTATPTHADSVTTLTLTMDNAVLLNGVKVDLLAAACYGVGDGKVGCNDINQPWRYDPMFTDNGFRVDTHNAHSQPDGSYHYHGAPNALFDADSALAASPVIGFAADGYPIFGSFFNDNGTIRKAVSSYQLKSGSRPSGDDDPGGTYDGTYRDDYEYVEGSGDLDDCNGMTVDGVYGYYITEAYPYVMACFKGTPDTSFNK